MSGKWPWNDTALGRHRRIIEILLSALAEDAPSRYEEIREFLAEHGQRWAVSDRIINVEDLVTAPEVAEEFGLEAFNVRDWARRHPDAIPRRGKRGNQTLYRLGDVLAYQAKHNRG